jgi:hypothetical protein
MIGYGGSPFTGTFDGSGFTITINVYSGTYHGDYVALFRSTDGAIIQNVGVLGSVATTQSHNNVALLIGFAQNTTIINSYASGTVSGNENV